MSFGGAASNRGGSGFMNDYRSMAAGEGLSGKVRAARYASSMNKWGAGAKLGAGVGLGLGAYGLDTARGEEGSEFYNSGAGKALGIGSSALTGASMGMMLGPWGALAGGLIGAGYGAFKEMNDGIIKLGNGEQYGKFGNNNIKFHENDKFTRLDDGMIAASTSVGQLGKLHKPVNTSKSSKVTHEHKYSGEIKLIMDNTEIGRIAAKEIIKNPKELNNFIINNNMGQATMNNGGITPAKKHR
jgi:hypothetical protein